MNLDDPLVRSLLEIAASFTGKSQSQIVAEIEARKAALRRRAARHNARYQAMVHSMDDFQAAKVDTLEAQGYRTIRMLQKGDAVAAMLQKDQVWNGIKGRLSAKLVVVYAGGKTSETFERSISINL